MSACTKAVAATVKEFGRLDVLVNNAAFQVHEHDFENLTAEHFDLTIKTNLDGYFYMAKAAVPHVEPGSATVNTDSVTGISGSGGLVDYSTTKGGIHAFTRAGGDRASLRVLRLASVLQLRHRGDSPHRRGY